MSSQIATFNKLISDSKGGNVEALQVLRRLVHQTADRAPSPHLIRLAEVLVEICKELEAGRHAKVRRPGN